VAGEEEKMAGRAATDDEARYRRNWQDEIDGAYLYRAVADSEESPQLAEVYRRLATTEERHAAFWQERLRAAGAPTAPPHPTHRARVLGWLARRVGPSWVVPTLTDDERRARTMYDDQPETAGTGMSADERSHARVLRAISSPGMEGGALARLEGRHRSIGGNALRAAVLGANDGLVSNLALVMGVAGAASGAALGEQSIVLAGLAGLLAGAFSMALGEWISVQSSRESAIRQVQIEQDELEQFPEEEAEELRLIYMAKGLPEDEARRVADRLLADTDTGLEVMAREELGVDPEDLGGSPWQAALASFVLFALGAVIPVAPFLLLDDVAAVVTSIVASGAGLFALGAATTLFSGLGTWTAGARQTAFGLVAAAITYGAGLLLGVTVG
jgi:vacuolar iron transporter family protein